MANNSNTTTKVTAAELTKMSNEFRTLAQKFNTHFETIKRLGNELDASWEGDAREAFRTLVAKETAKLAELYKVMTDYADKLDEGAKKYTATEKGNIDLINQA